MTDADLDAIRARLAKLNKFAEEINAWMTTHISVGACPACGVAEKAPQHSTCWACGHTIDHAVGHDCQMDD